MNCRAKLIRYGQENKRVGVDSPCFDHGSYFIYHVPWAKIARII